MGEWRMCEGKEWKMRRSSQCRIIISFWPNAQQKSCRVSRSTFFHFSLRMCWEHLWTKRVGKTKTNRILQMYCIRWKHFPIWVDCQRNWLSIWAIQIEMVNGYHGVAFRMPVPFGLCNSSVMHSNYNSKQLMELNGKCHEHKWHFAPMAMMLLYATYVRFHSHLSAFFAFLCSF